MNCRKAEQWLADRALGFLSDKDEQQLNEHLNGCAHCQAEAAQYQVLSRILESHTAEGGISGMAERVLAHARSRKKSGILAMRWLMPLAMGATALLMVSLTPLFFSQPNQAMTSQEVLKAYAEDFDAIGLESETTTESAVFNYENYGIPSTVSQYMN